MLLASGLGLHLVLLLALRSLLQLGTSVELTEAGLLVSESELGHLVHHDTVDEIEVVLMHVHVRSDLVEHARDEPLAEAEMHRLAKCALVGHGPEGVTLEVLEEPLAEETGNAAAIVLDLLVLLQSRLHHTTVDLRVAADAGILKALRLHQFSFLDLKEVAFVLLEDSTLVLFDDLDAGVFDRFADQNLEDRLDLVLVVEQKRIAFPDLGALGIALRIGHEDGVRSAVDPVVWVHVELVLHVVHI